MLPPTSFVTTYLAAQTASTAALPQSPPSSSVSVVPIAQSGDNDKQQGPPWVLESHRLWHNPTCYWDLYANDRQLPERASPPLTHGLMTVQICVNYCESAGYRFAGVEYGAECYCGHKRPHKKWRGSDKCTFACSGNKLEVCGGEQSLLMYELPCKTFTDCMEDVLNNLTLADGA